MAARRRSVIARGPWKGSPAATALEFRRLWTDDAAAQRDLATLRRLERLGRGVAVHDRRRLDGAAAGARTRLGCGAHGGIIGHRLDSLPVSQSGTQPASKAGMTDQL